MNIPFVYIAIENDRDWFEVAPTLRGLIGILRAKHPNPDYISFGVIAYVQSGEGQAHLSVDTYQWQDFHDEWKPADEIPLHWWHKPLD